MDLYRHALYYDIAFSFREVPAEMDFLLGLKPGASSFLELAAGPAAHAREAAARGLRGVAVDLSPEMAAYAGPTVSYLVEDMTAFRLDEPCDVAALLMDSASYLWDNEAVLRHLSCVADALAPGGVYVVELAHPRGVYGVGTSTQDDWTSSRDGVEVRFQWGQPGDPFDPCTGIREVTVRMRYVDGGRQGEVVATERQRCFTANEWRALVTASGRFRVLGEFGAMDASVPFEAPRAWRFVSALEKV